MPQKCSYCFKTGNKPLWSKSSLFHDLTEYNIILTCKKLWASFGRVYLDDLLENSICPMNTLPH